MPDDSQYPDRTEQDLLHSLIDQLQRCPSDMLSIESSLRTGTESNTLFDVLKAKCLVLPAHRIRVRIEVVPD